ncbi:riboflavin-specific deaminase [Gammaproteobacteria bacterium 42_54_T18]|nr:riboflavin-specific deaminase [Gammaproteobacteria bacterium 42_54_T18]
MNRESHSKFMAMALEESKKALPNCLPNPPVGCVLVQDGKVLASGYTKEPGSNHAEASAIQSITGSLENVVAYVTLEPCSFKGRTPSCANALIERNINEVFVAIEDPDPRNSGNGIKMLRDAGIKVTENILSDSVFQFLSPYLSKG